MDNDTRKGWIDNEKKMADGTAGIAPVYVRGADDRVGRHERKQNSCQSEAHQDGLHGGGHAEHGGNEAESDLFRRNVKGNQQRVHMQSHKTDCRGKYMDNGEIRRHGDSV